MAVLTRRSFLESLAAMAAASTLGLNVRKSADRDINWSLFCDDFESRRYDLTEPFDVDGIRYASDRRILVCREANGASAGGERSVPDVSQLQWDEFDRSGWTRLPDSCIYTPSIVLDDWECETCYGKGRTGEKVVICPVCDGEDWCCYMRDTGGGHLECCNGFVGGDKCGTCNGKGFHRNVGPLSSVQGEVFGTGYLNKIRTLGEVEVKVFAKLCDGLVSRVPRPCLAFRFGDEGRGFLMGIAPDALR